MAWHKPANAHEWVVLIQGHKKKFFFPAVTVMSLVVVASHWVPREYRAQAIFERENDSALEQMANSPVERNVAQIRMQMNQHVKGRHAIEQLIEDLNLNEGLIRGEDGELTPQGRIAKEDLIQELQSRISISPSILSTTLDQVMVSFTHPDRELAPRVVNQLVDNYIRQVRQHLDENLVNAKGFFENQVSHFEGQIRKLETDKLNFELEHPGLGPNDPGSVEEKLREKQKTYEETVDKLTTAKASLKEKEARLEEEKPFTELVRRGQSPELMALYAKKSALETELENHIYNMGRTEEHPAVVRVKQRIKELEERIEKTPQEIDIGREIVPNAVKAQLEMDVSELNVEIETLEKKRESLGKEIEELDTFQRNFFVIRAKYQKINRELTEAKSQFQYWDQNLRTTRLALTAEVGQRGVRLRVAERAPESARPSKPTVAMILMMAAGLGGAVGASFVFLSELLDGSVRTVQQAVDELKLPVFGAVNEIVSPREMFTRKVMAWGVYPGGAVVLSCVLAINIFLVYLNLNNPAAFETLMSNPRQYLEQTFFGR